MNTYPSRTPKNGAHPAVPIFVEKLVYGGAGLARQEGQVALVAFVLPGETVRVAIERRRSGILEAKLLEVIQPAAQRVEPRCPYFHRCGGCAYQHADYKFQLEQKGAILEEVLRRLGKLTPPAVELIAGPPWGYRNRAQFHLERGRIGYFEHGSRRLCAVERCPIASPQLNEALGALAAMFRDPRFPRFVKSLELFTDETQVQLNVLETERPVARRFFDWCAEQIPGLVSGALEYRVGDDLFRVSGASFFQVNRFLIEGLVERALDGAEGETAVDLYAGVGLFSLPLARRFRRVTAVESGGSAVRDLEFNAERAGLAVTVRQASAELFLLGLAERPDFVLADPPRTGLGKSVVRELLRLGAPRLTVVSCDPATLARDLAALTAGGYGLERLTLIDLFPQTAHLETVTHLRRPL
jgi:23S rRNA (uracil1939-C5)-methyltransferase